MGNGLQGVPQTYGGAREEHGEDVSLILGQCSETIRDRIEAHKQWDLVKTSSNALGLLRLIRQSLYQ